MPAYTQARAVLQQLLSHPDLAGIPVLLLANKQVKSGEHPLVRYTRYFCASLAILYESFGVAHLPLSCSYAATRYNLALPTSQDAPTALTPHEIEASFALQQILDSTQPRQVFGTAAVTGCATMLLE